MGAIFLIYIQVFLAFEKNEVSPFENSKVYTNLNESQTTFLKIAY